MGFKKFSALLIFYLLFCNLSAKGPLTVLKLLKDKISSQEKDHAYLNSSNFERKFVFLDQQYFNFKQSDVFFECIDKCCCDENFKKEATIFSEQEIVFFKDLLKEVPIVNFKINNIKDWDKLKEINESVQGLNCGFNLFFEERILRYEELNALISQYLNNQSDLMYSLILTKYELLREKQVSMIMIWNYFSKFFELLGLAVCLVYNKNNFKAFFK